MGKQILIQDIFNSSKAAREVDSLLQLNKISRPSTKSGPLLSDVCFRAKAPVVQPKIRAEKSSRLKRPRWRRK